MGSIDARQPSCLSSPSLLVRHLASPCPNDALARLIFGYFLLKPRCARQVDNSRRQRSSTSHSQPMQMVSALHGCSDFGAMSFTLMATTAPSPEPRHRRHRPAMKCLLQLLVAQSCIAWTACHANAAETPLRVRIAESDSVHNVGMQNLFAYMYSGAFDSANFAVLYGCQRVLLLSSLGGAGRLSGQKLPFFFSHRHLSIHHISLWSAESKAVKSIATGRKPWSQVNSLLT